MKNKLVAVSRHVLGKRTRCGSSMCTHCRSSTCSRSFTTSHTKSSGTWPKVMLLTCLGNRLPAGRQNGKRAVTHVFQCQMYTHLWHAIHAEVSYSRMAYRLFGNAIRHRSWEVARRVALSFSKLCNYDSSCHENHYQHKRWQLQAARVCHYVCASTSWSKQTRKLGTVAQPSRIPHEPLVKEILCDASNQRAQ